MGADATYSADLGLGKEPSDDELIRHASDRGLILLTRDEELYSRAKNYCRTAYVRPTGIEAQLALVSKEFGFHPRFSPFTSRCPKCNSPLARFPKKQVKDLVWPKVYEYNRLFWRCPKCGQVYWKGSHWKKIGKSLESLRTRR
jgi:hypothetical protein